MKWNWTKSRTGVFEFGGIRVNWRWLEFVAPKKHWAEGHSLDYYTA